MGTCLNVDSVVGGSTSGGGGSMEESTDFYGSVVGSVFSS